MTHLDASPQGQQRSPGKNSLAHGMSYFFEGFSLLFKPGLRAYIFVPIVVNIVLFIALTLYLLNSFDLIFQQALGWVPDFLQFLVWIVGFFVAVIIFIVYGYSFNVITTIIAAPFYGKLAQKAEELTTGKAVPDEALLQMVPRVFARELSKLLYFIPRGLFFLLLSFVFAPVLLIWGAWSMALQHADYSLDNHRVSFKHSRQLLARYRWSSFGFGAAVLVCSMIPFVNIFAVPAAVIGGTRFWVTELKPDVYS